jgi:hypothetical protein
MSTFIKPGRGAWSTASRSLIAGDYLRIRPTSTSAVGYIRAPQGAEAMIGHAYVANLDRRYPFEVIHEGLKVLQALVSAEPDGLWGEKSAESAMAVQQRLGLTADGIVGPVTMKALLASHVRVAADNWGISRADLGGIMNHESSCDLAAVGSLDGTDTGPLQINRAAHDVSVANAVSPDFSLDFTGEEMHKFITKWSPKVGATLAATGAVANHNSPAQAKIWMETGKPPVAWIAQYVVDARAAA